MPLYSWSFENSRSSLNVCLIYLPQDSPLRSLSSQSLGRNCRACAFAWICQWSWLGVWNWLVLLYARMSPLWHALLTASTALCILVSILAPPFCGLAIHWKLIDSWSFERDCLCMERGICASHFRSSSLTVSLAAHRHPDTLHRQIT